MLNDIRMFLEKIYEPVVLILIFLLVCSWAYEFGYWIGYITDTKIKVGNKVKLLGVPSWLYKGLPEDEQWDIHNAIGTEVEIVGKAHRYLTVAFSAKDGMSHEIVIPREFAGKVP